MQQILFQIGPLPIFGYGVMLAMAFIFCPWAAMRVAKREGVPPQAIQDLAVYVFIGGVIGGRLFSFVLEPKPNQNLLDFFKLWEGGLVFYGSLAGGVVAYLVAHFRIIRRHNIKVLHMGDIIAPCIGLGLFFGRLGCFLSGCCYGDVADTSKVAWGLQFPAHSAPHFRTVERGFQTAFGFTLENAGDFPPGIIAPPPTIVATEPYAEAAGLKSGDKIVKLWHPRPQDDPPGWIDARAVGRIQREVNGQIVEEEIPFLWYSLQNRTLWRPGDAVRMVMEREGQEHEIEIEPQPTLALHPTQLYSSLDGLILFLFLSSYYPFRKGNGEVLALFMIIYGTTRFMIEGLRDDTPEIIYSLTVSQLMSMPLFAGGIVLFIVARVRGFNAAQPGEHVAANVPQSDLRPSDLSAS